MLRDLIIGDDDVPRCGWGDGPGHVRAHHDEEWGRPLHGERELYELLTLVTFANGLSWRTVLGKRAAFEAALHGFDPDAVAAYGDADTTRLLSDAGIVRNRRKVAAAILNARATVALRGDGGLDALVWSFADAARDERPAPDWRPATGEDVPSSTPVSEAMARAFRERGFAFVGPTVAYALMETAGVVDDHLAGCACAGAAAPTGARAA